MAKKPTPLEKTSASLFDSIAETQTQTSSTFAEETTDDGIGRRISTWGIIAFVFGILSALTLVAQQFLFLPAFAAIAAFVSYYLIARSGGELTGKTFAGIGLALAIAFGIASPYSFYLYERDFNRQADEFIKKWFADVQSGNPALAHQLSQPYWQRAVFVSDQDVVDYWKRIMAMEEEQHHIVHSYLSNPTLLTIWSLGDRVKFSYYGTTGTVLSNSSEQTRRIYAVTVEPETPGEKPQTFFLAFVVERLMHKTPRGERLVGWTMRTSDFFPLKLNANGLPREEND